MQRICLELRRRGFGTVAPANAFVGFAEASDVSTFLAQFRGAVEAGADIGLISSDWPERERLEARMRLIAFARSKQALGWRNRFGPLVYVASGGTTGSRRFAVHTFATLKASALGFIEKFGTSAGASWNVLPLHHVGGLMTLLRALEAEAPWQSGSYRKLGETAPPKEFRSALSLVPTQLHRLLGSSDAVRNLRLFRRIFVGGAGLSEADAERARAEGLPLAPCYGMTETAAMVTALDPASFLRGVNGCGFPLPHARVVLAEGRVDEVSAIGIVSSSLALGWDNGEVFNRGLYWTQDVGRFDPEGHILVAGRLDRMINSGGEKVDPIDVERVLRKFPGIDDVAVLGFPDPEWGEVVVAFIVENDPEPDALIRELKILLRPAEVPKRVLRLRSIPRSAMGKIDRTALERIWSNEQAFPPA